MQTELRVLGQIGKDAADLHLPVAIHRHDLIQDVGVPEQGSRRGFA